MVCNDGYNRARFSVNPSDGTFIGDLIGVFMRMSITWFFQVFMVLILPLIAVGAHAQTVPAARSITVYQDPG